MLIEKKSPWPHILYNISMKGTRKGKNNNPYKDRRKFKAREIDKSLTHRARLRKNYFKLLEKEGYGSNDNFGASNAQSINDHSAGDNKTSEEGLEDGLDTDSETHSVTDSRSDKQGEEVKQNPKKTLNFAERAQIAKERKRKNKQQKLERIQQKNAKLLHQERERKKQKEALNQKTKTGQPLMGPRINHLLEKIKKDMQ